MTITWQPTCSADGHAIFFGQLGSFAAYTDAECAAGITGTHTMTPPPGNLFFLVVGTLDTTEGSFGVDSTGAERAASGGDICGYGQSLEAGCVP